MTSARTATFLSPTDTFTRPANTTAYAAGDVVANSATAGEVTPLTFSIGDLSDGRGRITRVRLYKSATTATLATFTLHLFSAAPTVANGDNGALSITSAMTGYLGAVQIDMTAGAQAGATAGLVDVAAVSPAIIVDLYSTAPASRAVYGLLEADAIYTPASAEVFRAWIDIEA